MKDEGDVYTRELPNLETPLQILERVLPQLEKTSVGRWIFIQKMERHALLKPDLEMLIAVRDWKKKQDDMNGPRRLV